MYTLRMSPLFERTSPALSLLRVLEEAVPLRPASAPTPLQGEVVTEDEHSYTLRVEVPGLRPEQLTLDVTPTTLALRGERTPTAPEGFSLVHRERSAYRLDRRLRFGHRLDPEKVAASLQDGILTVTLPKADAPQARRIAITTG